MLKTRFFWCFCFTVLFLLCLDFWAWTESSAWALFGLPSWVFYFVGVQILLAIALAVFATHYWRTAYPDSEEARGRDS